MSSQPVLLHPSLQIPSLEDDEVEFRILRLGDCEAPLQPLAAYRHIPSKLRPFKTLYKPKTLSLKP